LNLANLSDSKRNSDLNNAARIGASVHMPVGSLYGSAFKMGNQSLLPGRTNAANMAKSTYTVVPTAADTNETLNTDDVKIVSLADVDSLL